MISSKEGKEGNMKARQN